MVTITFATANAAFEYRFEEIARILRDLANMIEYHRYQEYTIRDLNGNEIGTYTYTEEK